MNKTSRASEEGIALLTATIFIAVAAVALTALTLRVVNQNNDVRQFINYSDCFQGVEAGTAQSIVSLSNGGTGNIGTGAWVRPAGTTAWPSFDDPGVAPLTLPDMPRVQFMAAAVNWATDGVDNNGDGVIDGPEERGVFTVFSTARDSGVVRSSETIYRAFDVNVWRNAIFAGSGQAGGLINGNVSIHGSVHLLGSNLPAGGTAIAAIDLGGTSLIHNNYVGITADLSSRIPQLPKGVFNGEVIDTLAAKLRVKRGLVGTSGNSEIGEPQVAGNGYKETMDGTYVSDGWTGTSVTPDGGRGDPTNVYSDNGWDTNYDLGDRVPFPTLNSDWRDPVTGNTVLNPATGVNYTHAEFVQTLSSTPYNGNITIKANQSFYYNATRPGDALAQAGARLATDDYIYYDSNAKQLFINGNIQINGSLAISRGAGNDKTIYYRGRAALLVNGDVTLDTDLYAGAQNESGVNVFPKNNCLGIMASGNMTVGSLSQLKLMGAFYAQGQIQSLKQTIVTGTFVSNYFNMGTNVPEIYQVPILADNLPYGMIGAYPIWVFSPVSWREL